MIPLSKAKLGVFAALNERKYRYKHRLFIVEGEKMVQEALASGFAIEAIVVREGYAFSFAAYDAPCYEAAEKAFAQLCSLSSPEGVLAVVAFPHEHFLRMDSVLVGGGFLLENLQDPGNVGTILRIADWFGLQYVICSKGTADVLNAKTLRACMGAIFRVKIVYADDFTALLPALAEKSNVWVADMEGDSLAAAALRATDWVLLGNEANGVSAETRSATALRRVTIPRIGGAESLNVGIAAGIFAYQMNL